MAFGDFGFPQVLSDLGLTYDETDLFSAVPTFEPRADFAEMIADGAALALAINSEKAKSEFIIAPILLELRRQLGGAFALFSGTELNIDPARGLNGVCDFIVSGSPRQILLTAPLVTIVEAKNDNLRNGLGQCIASMVAASLFNGKAGRPIRVIHGVVTTGAAWKFLKLDDATLTVDFSEYSIEDLGKILAILRSIVEAGRRSEVTTPSAP